MATTGSGTSVQASSPVGSYTLAELCVQWRARLADTVEPYLWSNDELTDCADKIQKQLCAEMNLIEDRTTAGLCTVSLVQGDGLIDLSQRILFIKRAMIDGQTTPLGLRSATYMDTYYPGWDGASVAQNIPTVLVNDGMGAGKGYLYPPLSSATGQLNLVVYRLPLADLSYAEHSGQALEIDRYAHLLAHGIMWQAYLKQDTDTDSMKRAENHRVLWEGVNGRGGDKDKIRRLAESHRAGARFASPMAAFM